MITWLSFLIIIQKIHPCSSIVIQESTKTTFALQLPQMKIYQETKRRQGVVGGSITVNRFNSKLSNEMNLVFVLYSRLATEITTTVSLRRA